MLLIVSPDRQYTVIKVKRESSCRKAGIPFFDFVERKKEQLCCSEILCSDKIAY